MPHITVSVDLGTDDPEFKVYDVKLDRTVGDLKNLITNDFGLPSSKQHVWFSGQQLQVDSQKLEDAGLKDQDMLQISQVIDSQQPAAQASGQDSGDINQQIEGIRRDLLTRTSQPGQREALANQAPELAAALDDATRFREVFMTQRNQQAQAQQGNVDDMSEEGQAKIMERIRQERVQQEADRAMDEHPELFGRINMLYVQLEVNNHPVKAFVDSGAQATIMSPSCAEACGVSKSIDARFAGIAKGVGTAKILGRVHMANVKIGNYELPCSFTVMEGKDVDMLLGLDMLKRYQACIDLQNNKLILSGSASVPFLGESEIPKNFEEAPEDDTKVPGPSTSTGGAGTAKPAPQSANASGNFAGQGRTIGTPSQSSQPANSPQQSQTQTPARSQPPARPSAPTPGQAQFPEESIQMVQGFGATREQAIEALRACNGNTEYAAGLFF